MGNPSRKRADRFHLLGMAQLSLQLETIRYITGDDNNTLDSAIAILDRSPNNLVITVIAIISVFDPVSTNPNLTIYYTPWNGTVFTISRFFADYFMTEFSYRHLHTLPNRIIYPDC